jgi:hypothetical protein
MLLNANLKGLGNRCNTLLIRESLVVSECRCVDTRRLYPEVE